MNKRKFFLTLFLFSACQFVLYAFPSDYGRDFHSTSVSVTIGQILICIILILFAYVGINHLFKRNKNIQEENVIQSSSFKRCETPQIICPKCKGQLFIELGELSSCRKELTGIDRGELIIYWEQGMNGPIECVKRVCPHCKGKGVKYFFTNKPFIISVLVVLCY